MTAKTQRKHFIVGLLIFLLVAAALAATAIVAEPNFFRHKVTVETYFLNSVNGLDPGTPVKFKGIPIGEVKRVGLSSDIYPDSDIETFDNKKSVAVVRMLLYFDEEEFQTNLSWYVQRGLRAQTQIAGLTGSLYISLDFLEPDRFPADRIPYEWTPDYIYIPSAPSLTDQIGENIKKFLASLDYLHLGSSVPNTMPTINALITNLDKLAANFSGEVINDLLANADTLIKSTDAKISEFDVQSLQGLTDQLDTSAIKLAELVDETKADELVNSINQLSRKFDNMVKVNQFDVRSLMNSLVKVTENLAVFTRELNDDPAMFFIKRKPAENKF